MQRGKHQVAGQRRLDRDLRRLAVADLADHDHVRVGANHGAQAGREGQSDLGRDLHLRQARHFVLDRVLDGDDVLVGGVQQLERRIQRGRLAGARRAGHQHRAVGLVASALEALAL